MIDPTSWAAGWGTLMLVNAGLAHAYGRSRFGWGLASLFLGPIATFFLVLVGKNEVQ
jgi:hypothetical protein